MADLDLAALDALHAAGWKAQRWNVPAGTTYLDAPMADFINATREAVPALTARVRELEALVNAKQSWIDGAKVDLEGLEADRDDWREAAENYRAARDTYESQASVGRAEVARLRGLLDAYMATVCACGHGRTSHNPADFGDCTECPHGTCGKYPGTLWDLWHRDTLAEVQRLREEAATTAATTQELIVRALDQEWAKSADTFPRVTRGSYAEGYLDGLNEAAGVARRPITEEA